MSPAGGKGSNSQSAMAAPSAPAATATHPTHADVIVPPGNVYTHLTHQVALHGHLIRCGAAAATLAPLAGPMNVRRQVAMAGPGTSESQGRGRWPPGGSVPRGPGVLP